MDKHAWAAVCDRLVEASAAGDMEAFAEVFDTRYPRGKTFTTAVLRRAARDGVVEAAFPLHDDAALAAFRRLLDEHLAGGGSAADVASLFLENEDFRTLIESRAGLTARLMESLPELFEPGPGTGDSPHPSTDH